MKLGHVSAKTFSACFRILCMIAISAPHTKSFFEPARFSSLPLFPLFSQTIFAFAFSISFGNAGGGANDEYQAALFVNDVEMTQCEFHRKLGTAGDVGVGAGVCLEQANVNDIINLKVKNIDSTTSIRVTTFFDNLPR